MQTADNLMLSGVLAHCPDCAVETIFVAPDLLDIRPGEHACTICGAALLIELSGPAAPFERLARSA